MDLAPVLPAIALATIVALVLHLLASGSRAARGRGRAKPEGGARVYFRRHRPDPPLDAPPPRD